MPFVRPQTWIRREPTSTTVPTNPSYLIEPHDRDENDDFLYNDFEIMGMDVDNTGSMLMKKLVVPGQLVTDDPQFMR